MLNFFPKYFSNRAIAVYFLALLVVSFVFSSYALSPMWMAFGAVEVLSFFYFSQRLSVQWSELRMREKHFESRLFRTALAIRVAYVVFSYFFYQYFTGTPFEFDSGDAGFYHSTALQGAEMLSKGNFRLYEEFHKYSSLSDTGYPILLSIIYFFVGKSIFLSRIVKALLSAWMCVLIYRLAQRNFGNSVGRMAGIFAMLMPHFVYYCGVQLKECEMIFISTWCLERIDALLRLPKIRLSNIILPALLGLSLFFFRTVLGGAAVAATGIAFVLSDRTALSKKRRWQVIALGLIGGAFLFGSVFMNEMEEVLASQRSGVQQTNMQWRANRKGGNVLAKYATGAVFAPMIFTLPFPTIVEVAGQENQKQNNGNNFVKNIMSFFVIFGLFMMIIHGEWRSHLVIVSFLVAYLFVLAMSNFAHSERFHLPSLPMATIMMAYGVSQMKANYKKYFNGWCIVMFVAIVGWSWFKLRGRGMV